MTPKKQFKGGSKKRSHYDKKLVIAGNTKYLAMGRIVPLTWTHVRVDKIKRNNDVVTLRLTKIAGESDNTRNTENNKGSKQNT